MAVELYNFQTECVTKVGRVQLAARLIADDMGLQILDPVVIANGFPLHHFTKYLNVEDRGFSEGPCLIWTGALGGKGLYGTFSWVVVGEHFQRPAHRIAHELFFGPIPHLYEVDHRCRQHDCLCHIEAVTKKVNMDRARKEICGNGHELTEDTIYRHPQTGNIHGCKECRREAVRRHKRKGVVS